MQQPNVDALVGTRSDCEMPCLLLEDKELKVFMSP